MLKSKSTLKPIPPSPKQPSIRHNGLAYIYKIESTNWNKITCKMRIVEKLVFQLFNLMGGKRIDAIGFRSQLQLSQMRLAFSLNSEIAFDSD